MGVHINAKAAVFNNALFFFHTSERAVSADLAFDTRGQFKGIKRFCNIVVRTEAKPRDFIGILAFCRKQNYRYIVRLTDFKSGVKTVKPFYPSTMTKTRAIYNEDGTPTGTRMSTKGTAAEEFRNHGGVQEAMEALAGKTLVVSNIETVRTLRFGTTSLMDAQIPTIDLK